MKNQSLRLKPTNLPLLKNSWRRIKLLKRKLKKKEPLRKRRKKLRLRVLIKKLWMLALNCINLKPQSNKSLKKRKELNNNLALLPLSLPKRKKKLRIKKRPKNWLLKRKPLRRRQLRRLLKRKLLKRLNSRRSKKRRVRKTSTTPTLLEPTAEGVRTR